MANARTGATFGIEAGINLAISGLLNALCAWLIYREAQDVPVDFWSLFIDTTITCFIVSICTAFFATASAKRYRRQGLRIAPNGLAQRALEALPSAWLPMGCSLFGMALPLLIAVFGIAFGISATNGLGLAHYMAFKGIWGGLFGALACVIILGRHLCHAAEGDAHD